MPLSPAEATLTFREAIPAYARSWAWSPRTTMTLAFWPCGQGYTQFEVKVAPQQRYVFHNVSLVMPPREEAL